MTPERRTTVLRLLALAAVIGLGILAFSLREHLQELRSLGYAGAFLIAFLSNATILLPIPGVGVVFTMGGIFNPVWIALSAGTGAALGELSGYLAGFSGQALVGRIDVLNRVTPFVQKYGMLGIVVLAIIPNPFFDLAGIAAGVLKIPLWKFLLAAWVGQCIKMLYFAYAGSFSLNWLFGN